MELQEKQVLTLFPPPVAAASEYASKGLDKLGETLPLLQKPVEQVRIKGCAVPCWQRDLVLAGFLTLGVK